MRKNALVCLFLLLFPALPLSADALILKTSSGSVSIYSVGGSYLGSLSCSGVVEAQTDGNLIAVLKSDGLVDVYSAGGSFKYRLSAERAVHVQVCNGAIGLQHANGSVSIYNADGSYRCRI